MRIIQAKESIPKVVTRSSTTVTKIKQSLVGFGSGMFD